MISSIHDWLGRLRALACQFERFGVTADLIALGMANLYGLYLWLVQHGG